MSNEFVREERYIVFKTSDLENPIKGDEIRRLAREYAEQRRLKGKKPLECVVVEKDWPEYEPTWRAIEARVTGAQPAPIVPTGWKLVPIDPTRNMLDIMDLGSNMLYRYRALLAAAPKPEGE